MATVDKGLLILMPSLIHRAASKYPIITLVKSFHWISPPAKLYLCSTTYIIGNPKIFQDSNSIYARNVIDWQLASLRTTLRTIK